VARVFHALVGVPTSPPECCCGALRQSLPNR